MPPTTHRAPIDAIAETPLALLPSWFSRIRGDTTTLVALDGPHSGATRVGSVSVLPVYGVIEHRSDWLMELFGEGASIMGLREALRAELNDPTVRAVVLDIDSPGGSIAGVTEFASELRTARGGTKPIVAVANTLAASAAYWLGSQADEFVVTPSGHVGSIGVYAVHQDVSRLLDAMGVTMTIVSAGPHKTEGNEFEPLSDEARAQIQSRVDASYQQFLADVAAGRRVAVADVEANYGGGRVFTARDALKAGLVDRVATLAQTVQRLERATLGPGRRMAAASLLPDLEASAIPRHTTETDNSAWDGNMAETHCPAEEGPLRASHAWVDSEGEANLKSSYKFIHHMVDMDGNVGAANMTACSTGIGYLNRAPGATGRPNIPDADRAGVHRHLAGHLTDGGQEAPPLNGAVPFTERITTFAAEAEQLVGHAEERARLRAKEGRPAFSTATERSLRAIRGAIDELLEPDDPAPSDPPPAAPVEPVPAASVTPPPAAPSPPRFRSRADWLAHLEKH